MSYLLRPPMLDERGLTSALRWYADGFTERSRIQVDLEVSSDLQRLPQEIEVALFRIVQKSLTNIHRHSGSSTATIRFSGDQKNVRLEVQDNGKGFSVQPADARPVAWGVGITGMRERVNQLGGHMEI